MRCRSIARMRAVRRARLGTGCSSTKSCSMLTRRIQKKRDAWQARSFRRGVKAMFVHADEPRDERLCAETRNFCIAGISALQRGALHAQDLPALYVDALVFCRHRARSIDDAHGV